MLGTITSPVHAPTSSRHVDLRLDSLYAENPGCEAEGILEMGDTERASAEPPSLCCVVRLFS